ncbi:MAG: hypothetical protein ACK5W0_09710 [Labrys sp. (in: a-proteobacteria)]
MTPRNAGSLVAGGSAALAAAAMVGLLSLFDFRPHDPTPYEMFGVELGYIIVLSMPPLAVFIAIGGLFRLAHPSPPALMSLTRGALVGLGGGVISFPLAALLMGLALALLSSGQAEAETIERIMTALAVIAFFGFYGTFVGVLGFALPGLPIAAGAGLLGAMASRWTARRNGAA